MRKNYHFQRVLRQCKNLIRVIKRASKRIKSKQMLSKLEIKIAQLAPSYRKGKIIAGILSVFALLPIESKGQIIEFNK